MEYRRFDDKIVARIDRGEEILEQVKELARRENITTEEIITDILNNVIVP